MLKSNKNIVFISISVLILLLLSCFYALSIFNGKGLIQPDIVHYKGGAKELLDYRASQQKETYWSDAMFGGMPTYQTGARFEGDWIKYVDQILNFLPKPANYLFLLFVGFYILGFVSTKSWKYALLGATFFGLSTYFYIIISAGHNAKVHTIAYFAPMLAGVLLVYYRRKYILGFFLTSIATGLQISANHPQMTYYLLLALGIFFISEVILVLKNKDLKKHFIISTAVVGIAFLFGFGMNAQRLMANSEYVKETSRGTQILIKEGQNQTGLDKESITMWSYGKLETLNLFIPRLMGGGSQEKNSAEIMAGIQQLVQENVKSQAEIDRISRGFSSTTYWGDQPGTSGPAYQGAVVIFLALIGFFFIPKRIRYWVLGASILTIFLAWGHNFSLLTNFFIDYVPLYNKFRAPSSILVVVELLFPLVAILGLYHFLNDEKISKQYKQKIWIYVSAVVLAFTIILLVFGKTFLGFINTNEKLYLPEYILSYLADERYKMFRTDALKCILYLCIVIAVLGLALKEKLNKNIVLVVIGLVSLVDLWSVNKNYLNESNFADKEFAEIPFLTETSDFLQFKAYENPYIGQLLSQVNINNTLKEISSKDQGHYRIYNQTLGTFNETNTSYYKSSIGGYSAAKLRRYDDLIDTYFTQMDSVKVPKILNMLNAKYMVFGSSDQPQAIMNPEANGNAWFVSDIKLAKSPNEEIKLIGEINNKRTAVIALEDKTYIEKNKISADSTAFLKLKQYQPDELLFSSTSKTGQLAVFSEIYYPKGWEMYVDGKQVSYIKANYLLRAVYVPAGAHEIRMIFSPSVIQTGKYISIAITLLFSILIILLILFRNKFFKTKID